VLSPVFSGDRNFVFDFNQPIVGNGHLGQDSARTGECAVWTGPGKVTSLFLPTVPDASLTVFLGVGGYARESIRDGLKVTVDGEPRSHGFAARPGLAETIEFAARPTRSFLRVDLSVPEVCSSSDDQRRRGVSLRNYGYRLSH